MIDYSVVIRTTGNAGEKYEKLLDSIQKLIPKPKEVIVVLPIGNDYPNTKVGVETFYFAPRGMVSQRLYGINQCKSKYALVCDDDVCFDRDFVQKLHDPIKSGLCEISAGPLLSFLPKPGIKATINAVMGAAAPTLFHRERYCSVLSTSGYSYNRNINIKEHGFLESESLPWTCFYASVEALKRIHLEEEKWLDTRGYAAMDDQTMFYKAKLLGIRTLVVTDALYEHLDAKTSISGNYEKRKNVAYSLVFNRYVFWHRFIYSKDSNCKKMWDLLCFKYFRLWARLYDAVDLLRGRMDKRIWKEKRWAEKEAKRYVKSFEYKNLSTV